MEVNSDIHKFVIEEEIEMENVENENIVTFSSEVERKKRRRKASYNNESDEGTIKQLSRTAVNLETESMTTFEIENVPINISKTDMKNSKISKIDMDTKKSDVLTTESKTNEDSIPPSNNNIRITNPVLDGKYFYVKRSYQTIRNKKSDTTDSISDAKNKVDQTVKNKKCEITDITGDIKNKVDVVCQNCKAELTVAVDNCSNLYRHMQRYHLGAVSKFIEYVNERKKKPNLRLLQCKTDERIITYFTYNMLPLSIVDQSAFKNLFSSFGITIFSRKTLYEKLKHNFEECKSNLTQMLSDVKHVCLTADIWSSKTRSFLGTTIHWLDNEMNRVSYVLDICRITGRYDYIKINELLEDILYKFNLNCDKVRAIITDNATNFAKYFKKFGLNENAVLFGSESEISDYEDHDFDDHVENKYDLDFNFDEIDNNNDNEKHSGSILPFHIRCVSHTLNLLFTVDFIEILNNNHLLRNIHEKMISKCNRLWLASRQPKTIKIIQNILKKKLPYPNITKWNSLYDSLNVIASIENNINTLCDALNLTQVTSTFEPLRSREKNYLNAYIDVMKPVYTALDQLQKENMFYGNFLPTIFITQKQLLDVKNNASTSEDNIKKTLNEAILGSFRKRFSKFLSLDLKDEAVQFAILATLSHPRFKIKWFEFLDDEILTKMKTLFIVETKKLLNCNVAPTSAITVKNEYTSADDYFDLNSSQLVTSVSETSYESGCEEKVELEIYRFFEDRDVDLKILNRYQFVKQIFIRFNTPLPTSAPVEQLFSFSTVMNTDRQSTLNDKLFVLLLFLRANRHMPVPEKDF